MKICEYCNSQIADDAKFCTNCGAALPVEAPMQQPVFDQAPQPVYEQPAQQPQPYQQPYSQPQAQPVVDDSGSIGWGILGFIIPIVGIVLFFVWRQTKPKSAKIALYGAVISIVLAAILRFTGVY